MALKLGYTCLISGILLNTLNALLLRPVDPLPVGIFWWFLHFWNPHVWYSPQDFIFGAVWALLFLGFIRKPRKLRELRGKAKRARKFSKKILVNAFDPNNSKMPRLNWIFKFGRNWRFWDTLTCHKNGFILWPMVKYLWGPSTILFSSLQWKADFK